MWYKNEIISMGLALAVYVLFLASVSIFKLISIDPLIDVLVIFSGLLLAGVFCKKAVKAVERAAEELNV